MDDKFAHHVLLVEKSTHKLYLYENQNGNPRLVKTYDSATGKYKGDKFITGDHKTPEGIYDMYEFISREELLRRHGKYGEIYGAGAFPMNYPNFMDTKQKKTGSGIWLHSTHDDNRVSKGLDSRGCVVLKNDDFRDISKFIQLNHTPIIVVQEVNHLSKLTWEKNKTALTKFIDSWAQAWKEKDFDTYISSYDEEEFYDRSKGRYSAFKSYKKAVFSRPDKPIIELTNLSILATDSYAVATLKQNYKSPVINDLGRKTLFLQKNKNYEWKIIGELWSKYDDAEDSFLPSQRFFKE